jgi:hypothetical protein
MEKTNYDRPLISSRLQYVTSGLKENAQLVTNADLLMVTKTSVQPRHTTNLRVALKRSLLIIRDPTKIFIIIKYLIKQILIHTRCIPSQFFQETCKVLTWEANLSLFIPVCKASIITT